MQGLRGGLPRRAASARAPRGSIEPSLRLAEVARSRAKPTQSLTAYDLYLRALPHRFAMQEGNDEALRLLRRAIAIDPGFAAPKGTLAGLHTLRATQGWAGPGDAETARGRWSVLSGRCASARSIQRNLMPSRRSVTPGFCCVVIPRPWKWRIVLSATDRRFRQRTGSWWQASPSSATRWPPRRH